MAFSVQALQAIEGFAANLGLASARPAHDGSFSFRFERSGTLTLTSAQDGERTLISLATPPLRLSEEMEFRILSQAGPDATTNRLLSAGLTTGGEAIFAVSVDDGDMNLPTLETCLQQLMAAGTAAR